MSVHLQSFLLKTPAAMLRAFVSGYAVDLPEALDWEGPRRSLVDKLTELIGKADGPVQDRIYSRVDQIAQFMTEYGRPVLRSVLHPDAAILSEFDTQEDV